MAIKDTPNLIDKSLRVLIPWLMADSMAFSGINMSAANEFASYSIDVQSFSFLKKVVSSNCS